MLYAQFLATQERRGKAPVDKDVGRSIDRIYAEHFATVSLHQITPARAAAREDLRNHFSLLCLESPDDFDWWPQALTQAPGQLRCNQCGFFLRRAGPFSEIEDDEN